MTSDEFVGLWMAETYNSADLNATVCPERIRLENYIRKSNPALAGALRLIRVVGWRPLLERTLWCWGYGLSSDKRHQLPVGLFTALVDIKQLKPGCLVKYRSRPEAEYALAVAVGNIQTAPFSVETGLIIGA